MRRRQRVGRPLRRPSSFVDIRPGAPVPAAALFQGGYKFSLMHVKYYRLGTLGAFRAVRREVMSYFPARPFDVRVEIAREVGPHQYGDVYTMKITAYVPIPIES